MHRRMKDKVLKGITFMAGITWMMSACLMDSDKIWIPITMNVISGLWLLLMAIANGATYIEVK